MHRHGLITALLLLSLLILPKTGLTSAEIHSKTKNFKYFKEGVSLLKMGRALKAQKKIKKSLKGDFILKDYSYLLLAEIQKRLGNNAKALTSIQKVKRTAKPVATHYSKKLSAEIYSNLEDFNLAFDYYIDFLSKQYNFVNKSEILPKLTDAYIQIEDSSDIDKKYLNILSSYLKREMRHENDDNELPFFDDVMQISDLSFSNIRIYENSGKYRHVLKTLRERAMWNNDNARELLSLMIRAARGLKDYKFKVKLLNEKMRFARNRREKANIQFSLGFSYLNMNKESMSLKYFKYASRNAKRGFLKVKSDYYIGRIYEFMGNLSKAADSYRKARKTRVRGEEEINFIIKALFRAGWVNYKVGMYKRAQLDFAYIKKRFGNRLTEEGYIYWLGKALIKRGLRKEAMKVWDSFYRDYPTSYYGLMCAIEIYNNFQTEIVLEKFEIDDFVKELSRKNENIVQRSLLLFMAGLEDFAKAEFSKIRINYNNIGEIYTVALISMILEKHAKAISLIDFLINKEKGLPGDEILKIYYPQKFFGTITKYASEQSVDPYMVLSLIRQESVFHVEAISKARAMGLMQVIPSLGKKVAGILELGDISERQLLNPGINLKVGIYHLGELMKKFDNNFIYSAAAYNSSEDKVNEWKKRLKNPPLFEFVEDIPYFETRKYVKLNVRNYLNYLRLYTDRDWLEVF